MILHLLTAVDAGGFGLLDDCPKMEVVHLAEHAGEVAAGPGFVACRVSAADGFKGGSLFAHKLRSSGFWFTRRCEDAKSL
jgi:hypothetical protein